MFTSQAIAALQIESIRYAKTGDINDVESIEWKQFLDFQNTGYSSDTYLFKLEIKNLDIKNTNQYLEINSATLALLEAYQGTNLEPLKIEVGLLPSINILLDSGDTTEIFVKTKFGNSSQIHFQLQNENTNHKKHTELIYLLFGGMLGILAYIGLVYLSIREKTHLYYFFYAFCVIICLANLTGVTYLLPFSYTINNWTTFFGPLALFFVGKFTIEFLGAQSVFPNLTKFFYFHGLVAISVSIIFLITGLKELTYLTDVLIASGAPLVVWAGYKRWKSGYRPAKFFFLSWTVVMGVALYWVGTTLGFIEGPSGAVTLSLGVLLEMLLLSLALSDHVSYLKRSLFLQSQDLNEKLRIQVANEKKIIESQQEKLIFSEKMASLGLMAKGIAHEVNNPLAILKGSAELTKLKLNRANNEKEIYFSKASFTKSLDQIINQSCRIDEIIQSLHNFARFDSNSSLEPVSLELASRQISTLVATHARKAGVKIQIRIPENFWVMARMGQVIQVGTNLIMNAIDASEESKANILVYAKQHGSKIHFCVEDQGPGIPPEIQDKVFEPFYTTKASSKGTGLGLSISKGLMEGQNGRLFFESLPLGSKQGCKIVAEFGVAEASPGILAS